MLMNFTATQYYEWEKAAVIAMVIMLLYPSDLKRKRTQRNDPSFPSSLTMKWDRIWAPKGEFN
jgi:hypothetical protein